MSFPVTKITLRLRAAAAVSAAAGLIAVMAAVGALFPSVGHTIGTLNVPKSVSNLLGGGDYGTITGWFRSEIASIYGPLVIGAIAITGAAATTAGEEEDRILGLVLAYPIRRPRLVAAKAAAIAAIVLIVALGTWIGLIVGVALGGGGITLAHMTALAVQLAFFGFATGALAIALGAGTGRRSLASGGAAAVAILGWLINSFAPLVSRTRLAEVPLPLLLLRRPRSPRARRQHRRHRRPGRPQPRADGRRDRGHRAPRPPGIRVRPGDHTMGDERLELGQNVVREPGREPSSPAQIRRRPLGSRSSSARGPAGSSTSRSGRSASPAEASTGRGFPRAAPPRPASRPRPGHRPGRRSLP